MGNLQSELKYLATQGDRFKASRVDEHQTRTVEDGSAAWEEETEIVNTAHCTATKY